MYEYDSSSRDLRGTKKSGINYVVILGVPGDPALLQASSFVNHPHGVVAGFKWCWNALECLMFAL
jgi:hypothetical protein